MPNEIKPEAAESANATPATPTPAPTRPLALERVPATDPTAHRNGPQPRRGPSMAAAVAAASSASSISTSFERRVVPRRSLDDAFLQQARQETEAAIAGNGAHLAATTTGTPQKTWYAVAKGRCVGVYATHAEMLAETQAYTNAVFRSCSSRAEAEAFVERYLDITQGRRGDPDPRHPSTLVAFCDGAVDGLGFTSLFTGYACIFPNHASWDTLESNCDVRSTAYREAIRAARCAVDRANGADPQMGQVLYIYTRNELLIRAMTEWIDRWVMNGWIKSDGSSVKHKDLFQGLVGAMGTRRVIWRVIDPWVHHWGDFMSSAALHAARPAPLGHCGTVPASTDIKSAMK